MLKYIGKAVDKLLGGHKQILPTKDKMRTEIQKWNNVYKGKPNWLSDTVKSMGLGASIASELARLTTLDRKSTRLNSSHVSISYAVFCLKKKKSQLMIHAINNDVTMT